MTNFVISGQQFTIRRQALNGFGMSLPNYSALSNEFLFKDETDAIYPMTMTAWADGVATFTLTAPTVTAPTPHTIVRTQNGQMVSANPSTLGITVVPPYKGKLDLTGSALASDCILDVSATSLFDYSLNNGDYRSTVNAYLPREWFTNTNQYVTWLSLNGITPGHTYLSFTNSTGFNGTDVQALSHWPSINQYSAGNRFDQLCCNVTDLNNLPVKTIIGVYAREGVYTADNVTLFAYSVTAATEAEVKSDDTSTSNIRFSFYIETCYDRLRFWYRLPGGANYTMSTSYIYTMNRWNLANQIIMVAATVTPTSATTSTIAIYMNGLYTGVSVEVSLSVQSVNETSIHKFLGGLGTVRESLNSSYGTLGYAQLDFACYSEVKSDDFLLTQAAAWGLA